MKTKEKLAFVNELLNSGSWKTSVHLKLKCFTKDEAFCFINFYIYFCILYNLHRH